MALGGGQTKNHLLQLFYSGHVEAPRGNFYSNAGRTVVTSPFLLILALTLELFNHACSKQHPAPSRTNRPGTNKQISPHGLHSASGGQNKVKDTPVPSRQAPVTLRPRDVTTAETPI